MDKQKQCISVRLSTNDIKKIKRISDRLNVSDSEILRVAIKRLLSKLRPLSDENSTGARLLPVFLEHGNELVRHFDLDTERLDHVVNRNADESDLVDYADIEMLAMQSIFPNYLQSRLETLLNQPIEEKELGYRLRDYLYSKYGQQRAMNHDST